MAEAESLKAARERVARVICESNLGIPCTFSTCAGCQRDVATLRELQRQAMEFIIKQQHSGNHDSLRRLLDRAAEQDDYSELLDGPVDPPPHHPPRCRRCGLHEGIGHPAGHDFQPQSPRCHRAHPHPEPCEPEVGRG